LFIISDVDLNFHPVKGAVRL